MSTPSPAQTPGSTLPQEALGARPGPHSVLFKVLSAALSGGLLVVLFAAIIPKVADFDSVWDSLAQLRPSAVLLLLVLAVAIRLLLALAYTVLTPGLSLLRSLIAREASSAVSNVVPGPSGTASQFVILRSWGVSVEQFTRATIAVSVTTDVLIFAGPGIAFVAWALVGMPAAPGGDHAWAFGLAAVVLAIVAVVLVAAVARSERLAAALGRVCQACVNPLRRLVGKPPVTTWPDRSVAVRADTIAVLRDHGSALLACIVGGYVINGFLLVLCIWACGVSWDEMPLTLGILLYTIGRISTVVSITPGGVGVVEIAYSTVYIAVLGDSAHDAVVAGVLLYRALTYLLPIVTGAAAYLAWRLMRRHELHEVLTPAPTPGVGT
jgi:putative heme transporter